MTTQDYLLNAEGYVIRGFFAGGMGKMSEIAKVLGIEERKIRRYGRSYCIQVSERDKVTPEQFTAAERLI